MKYILLAALFCSIIFMGCPLETKYAIDNGSYDVPAWLVGTWKGSSRSDSKTIGYVIKSIGDSKGTCQAYVLDSLGGTSELNKESLIFSSVGDKVFLNVYEAGDDMTDAGYYLYLFNQKSESEIELIPIRDGVIDTEIEQDSLKAWLSDNINDSALFDSTDISVFQKEQ